jgi:Putative Ig domain.
MPSGSAVWAKVLSISRGIELLGAGDTTVITRGAATIIAITIPTGNPTHHVRIGYFHYDGGTITSGTAITVNGGDPSQANSRCRIDHINFANHAGGFVGNIGGAACGVIDHCYFGNFVGEYWYVAQETWGGKTHGDGAWFEAYNMNPPSDQAWYWEDNVIDSPAHHQDGKSGSRAVYRHNTITKAQLGSHGGLDSSARDRGAQMMHVYNNIIVRGATGGNPQAIHLRGGSAIIFNNYLDQTLAGGDWGFWLDLDAGRLGIADPNFGGCADGVNPWDKNSQGTITVTGGSIPAIASPSPDPRINSDSGSIYFQGTWGGANRIDYADVTLPITVPAADSLKSFSLVNITQKNALQSSLGPNTKYAALIQGNDASSGGSTLVHLTQPGQYQQGSTSQVTFRLNNGDNWVITHVDKNLDGIGRGNGTILIQNQIPSLATGPLAGQPGWSNQVTWGVFQWHNILRSSTATSLANTTTAAPDWPNASGNVGSNLGQYTSLAQIRVGRDVFNSTPAAASTVEGIATFAIVGTYNWNVSDTTTDGTWVGADSEVNDLGYNTAYWSNYPRFRTTGSGGFTYPHPLTTGGIASPRITSPSSTTFTTGTSGSFQFSWANFTNAPTWSETGSLPAGVSLNPTTGLLSGSPGGGTADYPITVTATYAPAGESTTQNFILHVISPNQLPSCTLDAPTNGQSFTGTTVNLSATASDPEGALASVSFYRSGSTLIGTVNAPGPYNFVWTGVGPGTYVITAKSTDAAGGVSSASNAATITVVAPPSLAAPTIVVTS